MVFKIYKSDIICSRIFSIVNRVSFFHQLFIKDLGLNIFFSLFKCFWNDGGIKVKRLILILKFRFWRWEIGGFGIRRKYFSYIESSLNQVFVSSIRKNLSILSQEENSRTFLEELDLVSNKDDYFVFEAF
jgi:hypothetical protein